MNNDKMHLDVRCIPQFEADAQYPPIVGQEPIRTVSSLPGVARFNQGVLAAVALGKEFDTAARTGVESFKQITRRCGVEYVQNDEREATDIARTAATKGNQVEVVDETNKLRRLYPSGSSHAGN